LYIRPNPEALADKTCGGAGYLVGGNLIPEIPYWVGDNGGNLLGRRSKAW